MLYWGLDEQARHEHTSDEYKDDILFRAAVTHIPGLSDRYKFTTLVPTELN